MKGTFPKWIGLLVLVLPAIQISFAQQIKFRNYTVADGLCANTVWAMTQDNKGYMWFGTKDGLNRFDGYQFKSYRFDKNDSFSIGNNRIRTIFNYNKELCWVGTERGVYILHLATERFQFFEKLGKRAVFDIMQDASGLIWIATGGGVFQYNPADDRLNHFEHKDNDPNSLSVNFVRQLMEDDDGNIWMGTAWNGIDVWYRQSGTFTHYKASSKAAALSGNFITKLYKDRDGNIWVGTEKGGLDMWDKLTQQFRSYRHQAENSLSDNIIHDVFQTSSRELFIGTEKGLDILDPATGKFRNYNYHPNDPFSISDNAVYAIYQDKTGGIWVGTYFGGVNYFHPENSNFELYYPTGSEQSISGKAVSGMLQEDSIHIWVGTEDGGLNLFNSKTRTFQRYPFKAGQENLSYHNIHTLIKDRSGNIWIGTFTGGINVYHPSTGKVTVHKFSSGSESSSYGNIVYDLFQDGSGIIWIGTVGGLFRYDPVLDQYSKITDANLDQSWVYNIYEDTKGNLWLGTYNQGLYKKEIKTGKWLHYLISENADATGSEKIISISGGQDGELWIGTDGGGLFMFQSASGKCVSFKNQYGLNADIIYGILKDKKEHLWLSSNNGLFDFDPMHKSVRHYSQWDNLQGKQFNYKSYLKAWDGKFYFGGVRGLNAFYPERIHSFNDQPSIIFTNFQLFNKDVVSNEKNSPLEKTIAYSDQLTLTHRQSMFSIEYAALNYIAPRKTRYAYKMEGYDKDWNYVDDQRKATYTNLPAGQYVFKVKATDNNGDWSVQPAKMAIQILPPFYQTPLAYVIYVMLILGTLWFFRTMEINKIRRRNQIKLEREQHEKEQEFYKQKIDFFTSMAHEIRTPLSLIIAPLEKLIRVNHWKPGIKEQLTIMDENSNRLLELTNQLLDFRKMESDIYTLHPERIEIVSLIHNLFSRFSSISYQKGIKFFIEEKVQRLDAEADPEALTKILSNLLINAFKFTRSYVMITINTPYEEDGRSYFSVSVEDDGIGIPAEDLDHIFEKFYQVSSGRHQYNNLGGNGIGLALAKALTEKHGGTLTVKSGQNVRTVFTVTIPFVPVEKVEPKQVVNADISFTQNSQSILIVEDDPALLNFLFECVVEAGFNGYKSADGESALELMKEKNIDLTISDVMMPGMDGLEFCRKIKSDMEFSHVPLILLTARANMEIEIEGIESGADAYITKPFKWQHVLATIHNLLDSRKKLKEKFSRFPFTEPGSLVSNSGDRKFIDQVISIIDERMDDPQLSVEVLSSEMAMSRSSLHKKLKAISGHVPNEFIRLIRLRRAAKLLLQNEYSISEIGYMAGFNSPSYFSRCFSRQFKFTPKEFIENQKVQVAGNNINDLHSDDESAGI